MQEKKKILCNKEKRFPKHSSADEFIFPPTFMKMLSLSLLKALKLVNNNCNKKKEHPQLISVEHFHAQVPD